MASAKNKPETLEMKTIANMNTATNSRTHQPSRRTITTALGLAAANLVTYA